MSACAELIFSQLLVPLAGLRSGGQARVGSLLGEGRAGKMSVALLCRSAMTRGAGEEGGAAHKCRFSACNTGLGACPNNFLPYLLHRLPLLKLAEILPGVRMKKENSPQREFFWP